MLARQITEAFVKGTLNLTLRGNPSQGWKNLPEVRSADRIRAADRTGATDDGDATVRVFCTLMSAMDRARVSAPLWESATQVFLDQATTWVFDPTKIVRDRDQVATILQPHKISQRHGPDADGWCRIGTALADLSPVPEVAAVQTAVGQGVGDAGHLLDVVQERHEGVALFPLLRGPKIRAMWVRMLVYPGHATKITNLAALPVAVDTHVHRVTYYLQMPPYDIVPQPPYLDGAAISGDVRLAVSAGWQHDIQAHGAVAPPECPGLVNTAGSLDPALWFVGKHGCKQSHEQKQWLPIHSPGFCDACRLNPANSGSIPATSAAGQPASVRQVAGAVPAQRNRSQGAGAPTFGRRQGFERPSHYWNEFQLAEQNRDVGRREQAIREYYLSQGYERDDPDDDLVRDFTEIQLRYEISKGQWGNYSWRKVHAKGVARSCVEWVEGPPTEGFQYLVAKRLGGLTTEALVIQHSDRFGPKIVARAAQRVIAHADGFPPELVALARLLLAG